MESAGPSPGGIGARSGAAVVGLRRSAFAAVASSPPVTRGLACALVFCFFLQLLLGDAFRKQFSLVPAKVIPKLWMLLTAAIVELNLSCFSSTSPCFSSQRAPWSLCGAGKSSSSSCA